jgi:hypothetical protein
MLWKAGVAFGHTMQAAYVQGALAWFTRGLSGQGAVMEQWETEAA